LDIPTVSASGIASPGSSAESLLELVRSKVQEARESQGQPPLDQATLDQAIGHALGHAAGEANGEEPAAAEDEPRLASYTSAARSVPVRATRSGGTISIFA